MHNKDFEFCIPEGKETAKLTPKDPRVALIKRKLWRPVTERQSFRQKDLVLLYAIQSQPKNTNMQIALHKGTGWISRLIRWQTRSLYSHASILFKADEIEPIRVIEAREFKGVQLTRGLDLTPGETVDIFDIKGLWKDGHSAENIIHFLGAQIGKPYDYRMVLRFVSRRGQDRRTVGKWFCSELVYAAFLKGGLQLLGNTEPWEVSPGLLARSPYLLPNRTIKESESESESES